MAEDIKFGVGADAGPFRRTMAGLSTTAKGAGNRAGKEFTKSFNNFVNRFLGVGAIIGVATKFMQLGRAAQKTQISSILEGLSPERIQALERLGDTIGSKFTNLPIEEQIKFADMLIASGEAAIKTSGQIEQLTESAEAFGRMTESLEQSQLTFWASLNQAVEDAATNMYAFKTAQRDALEDAKVSDSKMRRFFAKIGLINPFVFGEVSKRKEDFAAAGGTSPSKKSTITKITEIIKNRQDGGDADAVKPMTRTGGFQTPVDNLQRMGLFVGGAGNPAITIAREQVNVLKQIHQEQRRMVAALNEL